MNRDQRTPENSEMTWKQAFALLALAVAVQIGLLACAGEPETVRKDCPFQSDDPGVKYHERDFWYGERMDGPDPNGPGTIRCLPPASGSGRWYYDAKVSR